MRHRYTSAMANDIVTYNNIKPEHFLEIINYYFTYLFSLD
jgi:hypothetical protein